MGSKNPSFYPDFKMELFIFVSSSVQKLEPKTQFLGSPYKIEFFGSNF
jgi:hypothetical protein